MIERGKLLSDLQSLLRKLEADLLERSDSREVPEVGQTLRDEYQKAQKANRTAQSYEEWRSDYITQIAAAWVVSCVFARFLEDNRLVDPPRISGPGERLARSRDEHELYFRAHPTKTDREYLLHIFGEFRKLPGAKEIFGEHNSVHELPNWLSGDAAGELLKFFQRIDANSGSLVHDFTDPSWDTRFLGDLYQDLSEAARKKYALLQTPVFVEEFILDHTLDPAIKEFGLEGFRMIDPASGSGHFLLGSFHRILQRWLKKEPGTNLRVLVQRTLDSIHGVDVNPYAVAIARFRLLLLALRESQISRLQDAPEFHFNLAAGDSLLHGVPGREQEVMGFHELAHHYQSEDLPALRRILRPGIYHTVVANPPYITVKDGTLNQAYRERFSTCHMKYSLAVPFMERIFQLAVVSGFTGQITGNSFMKREFGKTLIEQFLPTVDLTHVIDTSGAFIPGHTTPTVILFGRRRKPVTRSVRAVLGIRGEPEEPLDPAHGKVWTAIATRISERGYEDEMITVTDVDRTIFSRHPWTMSGGGAADLKQEIDSNKAHTLKEFVDAMGPMAITGLEDVFVGPPHFWRRFRAPNIPYVVGESIRDWAVVPTEHIMFPYNSDLEIRALDNLGRFYELAHRFRILLLQRTMFGKTQTEAGLTWYEYRYFERSRASLNRTTVTAYVATHNHFADVPIRFVGNQHATIVKFRSSASDDDYFGILAYLNSSLACFWMKQVCSCKGLGGQGGGIKPEEWHRAYEFDSTKLLSIPIPRNHRRLADYGKQLVANAMSAAATSPAAVLAEGTAELDKRMKAAKHFYNDINRRSVALQEELDWEVYKLFDLFNDTILDRQSLDWGMHPLDRPVEARLVASLADGVKSIFYEVHQSRGVDDDNRPLAELVSTTLKKRIAQIENDRKLSVLETINYKRRWQCDSWTRQITTACSEWLLDRLESYFDLDGRMNEEGTATARLDFQLVSIAKLADLARQDEEFMRVGELYRDDSAFEVQTLVEELVAGESVPLLPVLRYKDSGLRKRAEWERTWDLQRQEDAIDARTNLPKAHSDYLSEVDAKDLKTRQLGDIPVPPKYTSADFLTSDYWRLRGKLDVPKERWVSFPYCEGEDAQMVIAWAGYDHLQLAKAISAYYVDIQERLGGRDDPRLEPLLASLIESLPWLKQWHNAVDPEFNVPMGDYFEGFIQEEARQMSKTVDEIKNWVPPKKSIKTKKKKTQ